MVLPGSFLYKYLFESPLSIIWGMCQEEELLDRVVILYLIFWGTTIKFFKWCFQQIIITKSDFFVGEKSNVFIIGSIVCYLSFPFPSIFTHVCENTPTLSQKMLNRELKGVILIATLMPVQPAAPGHCFTQHSIMTEVNSLTCVYQVFPTLTNVVE